MEITTRKANGFDATRIGELLQSWLLETEFNYPGVCPYSHVWLADFIYKNPCFVILVNDLIVGTIGLRYGNFPWNNEFPAFFCDFLIIDSNYRTNGISARIIDEVKKLSDGTKVPLFMGIMTGSLADKKDRFLEMTGFKYAGGNFVYGV